MFFGKKILHEVFFVITLNCKYSKCHITIIGIYIPIWTLVTMIFKINASASHSLDANFNTFWVQGVPTILEMNGPCNEQHPMHENLIPSSSFSGLL
jgi:hypothetical protein